MANLEVKLTTSEEFAILCNALKKIIQNLSEIVWTIEEMAAKTEEGQTTHLHMEKDGVYTTKTKGN